MMRAPPTSSSVTPGCVGAGRNLAPLLLVQAMPSLYEVYMSAVGGDAEGTLKTPGAAYVAELLNLSGLVVAVEEVKQAYASDGLDAEQSFTWSELQGLAMLCGWDPLDQGDEVLATDGSASAPQEATNHVPTPEPETADVAGLVDFVVQRASLGQFPCLKPTELKDSEAAEEAELILRFVRRTEVVQLQSFLEHKYVTYLQSCPAEESMSEGARRLSYATEFYYKHVHEFLCGETLRVRSFRHHFQMGLFVPLVSPSMLPTPEETSAAAACLGNVMKVVRATCSASTGFEFLQSFAGALWGKWSGYEGMAKFSVRTIEEVFCAFLRSEYYATMGDVIEEMERVSVRVLEAAVPVSIGGASRVEQNARSALLASAHAADMIRVDECIEAEYDRLVSEMSPVMRGMLPDGCSVEFRRQR